MQEVLKSQTTKDGSEKIELINDGDEYYIQRTKLNQSTTFGSNLEGCIDLQSAEDRFKQLTE